jgi:hypothetical protein
VQECQRIRQGNGNLKALAGRERMPKIAGRGMVLRVGRTLRPVGKLRSFRDQVLARSAQGQALINSYYRAGPELLHHFAANADVRAAAAGAIVGVQPLIRDMVSGTGELVVSSNQVGMVNGLITKLNEVAGVELQSVIQHQMVRVGPLDGLVGKTAAEARELAFGIPIQIVNARIAADGTVEFTVTGVVRSGSVYAEYSEDLVKWTQLGDDPMTKLPAVFRDVLAVSATQLIGSTGAPVTDSMARSIPGRSSGLRSDGLTYGATFRFFALVRTAA